MLSVLPELEQVDIDIPEIQELDGKKVIEAKIHETKKYLKDNEEFIVEDTSLVINEMNGMPGPLIKWFLKSLGLEGIWNLAKNLNDKSAVATVIIGYYSVDGLISFFEAQIEGHICEPRGEGFGWDSLFIPKGSDKSFGEMTYKEKSEFNARIRAAKELQKYRDKK